LRRRIAGNVMLGAFVGIASAVVLLGLLPADAVAAEKISEGRKIWDLILRWVNFGILVFLFLRYGKTPLMNFLRGESNRVAKTLHEIEKDLNVSKMRLEEEAEKLEDIEGGLEDLRKNILEMGEKEKERILEDARSTADQMIVQAKSETEIKLEGAKRRLNDNLVDRALGLAEERLQASFSDQDNEQLLQGFVGDLQEGGSVSTRTL